MKKIKLFLMALLAMGALGGLSAQTDVTSTYITDADLSTIENWTQYHPEQYWSLGNGLIGTYAVANDKTSTSDDNHLTTEYCLGIQCRWSTNYAAFQQTKKGATLPAGAYTLTFDVENTNASTSATYNNLFYVKVGETTYSDTKTEWMSGNSDWTTHSISFTLEEQTTADIMFSFGYGTGSNNFGSGSTPHIYVSHLAMTLSEFIDPTDITIPSSLEMIQTAKKTLTVTYTPNDANHNTAITWDSSNDAVATVANGVVTAVSAGTATITATTVNGKSATCDVTVNEAPIANGDYYIMNVSKGKYLSTVKNGWGTQAGVADHGIPFTATLANGVYTLDSKTYNSDTQHFLNGTYVDGNSTSLYIKSLDNGKYSISTGESSAYLTANNNDVVVANTANDALDELAQWTFVTKAELVAALANATTTSPVDATLYIGDPDFSRNYWPAGRNKSSWSVTASNRNLKGGDNGNMCAETYQNGGGTIYQTLTVPNGRYGVKCQGFYRQDSGSTPSYLYANQEKQELSVFNANSENTASNMGGASASFSAGLYQNSELMVDVTDGTLTVGIEGQDGNWTCFDNFELYYYGPNLAEVAEELPASDMTADNWYYFDIAVDGDYNLTTTTLNDIIYTSDGTILIENENTVTANFGTSPITLTAGRYYVKSTSAQTLAVAPLSYNYEIGVATLSAVDDAFIQGSTFTVTFPDAATNDPDATAALVASSKATVNDVEVALSAVTNGFSLDLGTLEPNKDYVVAIPAEVYGYADQSMNSPINVTVHTPAVFDGEYCLYDATSKLFLGRGNSWGTEASVDKYGIPFNLVTDATNTSSIEFVDWTGVYLFLTGTSIFTDNASTGWQMVATEGGYYLMTADNAYYAAHASGNYGEYVYATNNVASATVWTLMTKAERDAIIAAYPTDNISNVITASGISTTADAFESYLSNNYNAVDCTTSIGTATFSGSVGDWTWNETNRTQNGQPAYGTNFAEVWCATGAFTQAIDKANLPAGIYKVTVQGYERRKDNNAATALYNDGYNLVSTFLSANGEQVRFTDWNEVDGKPTNTGSAVTAFNNGEAVNVVYVYLDGNTDLTITVRKPNYIWDCWTILNNFTLTRYEQAEATMTIGDAKYATFVAPFDVTIPSGVTAWTIDGVEANKQTLTLTNVNTTISANTPVVLYSESNVNETFKGKTIAADDLTEGLLTGVYADISAPAGSYVLQNNNAKVGFYRVAEGEGKQPTVVANRAYLTAPNAGVKAFFFPSMTTAIQGVFSEMANGNIYDLQGRKVQKMQKGGVYVINGQKVTVK